MTTQSNVTVLERDGRRWSIIGTAHVSQASVAEVEAVIEELRPDTVCVELCAARHEALTDENRWKKLDVFQVIREGKTLFLLANLAVGAYQRRLGEQLGVTPGAELLAAVRKAEAVGAQVELVDRNIHATLKRTWANLGFFQKVTLFGAILQSLVTNETISEETIESMKETDQLRAMMEEFARVMPAVKEPLIDERDRFLMSAIEDAPGDNVVAVVGAGHVHGMIAHFGREVDREALSEIPPPSRWVSALKWILPLAIVLAFGYGYQSQGAESLEDMLWAWILPNSVFAGLLTVVAGGTLLSILAAFLLSPITSLNPLLGAGMVVGLLEAWQRRPTVEDAEAINQDVQSLGGIYRNPFTRVLLVAVLANLGSALGAWIGLSWVLSVVSG
jgi:pheromone shutdown-related protein TraB